jgi:hypothetical protein
MPKVGRNPPCPCGRSKQHERRSPAGAEATSRAARCLFAIVLGWAHAARAEPGPCERPAIELLRYDEDYAFLRDPSCRTDLWDPAKYVALAQDPSFYVSFGADLRERFEYYRDPDWGGEPDDGYLLHRLMAHADLHLGAQVRMFVQLTSNFVIGRAGGPGPNDQDKLDLHQAFLDVQLELPRVGPLTIRSGRQEIDYEDARLITVRDGSNVRLAFDGVRLMQRLGDWRLDAFATAPVETDPGVFDDGWQPGQWLWGAYAFGPVYGDRLGLDLFYFGFYHRDAAFEQGIARESRHSFGARVSGKPGSFDYNIELVYQFGSFGAGAINAWMVASEIGYTLRSAALSPRFGLQWNATSGDENPFDRDLQTFNPLFPQASYFTDARLIGPLNHIDVHPVVELQPAEDVVVELHHDAFWRESLADGLYRTSRALIVAGEGNPSRYVGSEVALRARWQPDRHTIIIVAYSHFFGGPFLRSAGLERDVDFFAAWISYRM